MYIYSCSNKIFRYLPFHYWTSKVAVFVKMCKSKAWSHCLFIYYLIGRRLSVCVQVKSFYFEVKLCKTFVVKCADFS